MEIATQQLGDSLEVKVRGRLDNYWTEHLRRNLEEIVRAGAHNLRLNLSEISFLSSAGVGLLVAFHTQLKGIGGNFAVTSPSERVKQVIELCHLSPILLSQVRTPGATSQKTAEVQRFTSAAASFEVIKYSPGAGLRLQCIGDPRLLHAGQFTANDSRTVKFPPSTFGLGLGAFGDSFEDVRTRYGEFVAVAGSAAYLPTDGTNVPDFMIASGDLVPEMNVLYGLQCEGGFDHLMRFDTADGAGPVSLTDLVRAALDVSGAPLLGMVMVAESAGLLGAALRRSPASSAGANDPKFKYPEVRSWISFTPERLFSRSLALVIGIATNSEYPSLAPMLRPVGPGTQARGHFHAAAFSYRPLKKGDIDLKSTVTSLFEAETLQGVLHLLTDNRQSAGAQQSEFVRGACWIGAANESA